MCGITSTRCGRLAMPVFCTIKTACIIAWLLLSAGMSGCGQVMERIQGRSSEKPSPTAASSPAQVQSTSPTPPTKESAGALCPSSSRASLGGTDLTRPQAERTINTHTIAIAITIAITIGCSRANCAPGEEQPFCRTASSTSRGDRHNENLPILRRPAAITKNRSIDNPNLQSRFNTRVTLKQ